MRSKMLKFFLFLLTLGASLTLGLLSFSGMIAILPLWPLALGAFILSIAYEGEIYLQNIKGAFKKLCQPNYLRNTLSNKFLYNHLHGCELFLMSDLNDPYPTKKNRLYLEKDQNNCIHYKLLSEGGDVLDDTINIDELHLNALDKTSIEKPGNLEIALLEKIKANILVITTQRGHTHLKKNGLAETKVSFFDRYILQWETYIELKQNKINQEIKHTKKAIKQKIKAMEATFSEKLLGIKTSHASNENLDSQEALELDEWLKNNEKEQKKTQKQFKKDYQLFGLAGILSIASSIAMSFGTFYLLNELPATLPFISIIPASLFPPIIITMSIIAGIAYGLLSYNSIIEIIQKATISKFFKELRDDFSKKMTGHTVGKTMLAALALFMTICTAGTWSTIVKNSIISMGIAVITGMTSLLFNLHNSFSTFKLFLKTSFESISDIFSKKMSELKALWATENVFQFINPMRISAKILMLSCRSFFFIGHVISIGFTSDQGFFNMSPIILTIAGAINEAFEDIGYFIEHDQDTNKPHHDDNNSKKLGLVFKKHLKKEDAEHKHDHATDLPSQFLFIILSPIYLLATIWDFLSSQINHQINYIHREPYPVLSWSDAWGKQTGHEQTHSHHSSDKKHEKSPEKLFDDNAEKSSLQLKQSPNLFFNRQTKPMNLNVIEDKEASMKNHADDKPNQLIAAYH